MTSEMVCNHAWSSYKLYGWSAAEKRPWYECRRCWEKWFDGDPEPRVVLAHLETM